MPCNTIQRSAVALEAADPDMLRAALVALGFQYVTKLGNGAFTAYDTVTRQTLTVGGGRVQLRAGTEARADAIKQAYTAEVLRVAAKRYGFRVNVNAREPHKLTLTAGR